jgi:hypothetical protein
VLDIPLTIQSQGFFRDISDKSYFVDIIRVIIRPARVWDILNQWKKFAKIKVWVQFWGIFHFPILSNPGSAECTLLLKNPVWLSLMIFGHGSSFQFSTINLHFATHCTVTVHTQFIHHRTGARICMASGLNASLPFIRSSGSSGAVEERPTSGSQTKFEPESVDS